MSFSILSMLVNSAAFLIETDAKLTNIMILTENAQMLSMYSIKPRASRKIYIKYEAAVHPSMKKPMNSRSLNEYLWIKRFDGRMPTIAYFFRTVLKIFILFCLTRFSSQEITTYPMSKRMTTKWDFSSAYQTLSFFIGVRDIFNHFSTIWKARKIYSFIHIDQVK